MAISDAELLDEVEGEEGLLLTGSTSLMSESSPVLDSSFDGVANEE